MDGVSDSPTTRESPRERRVEELQEGLGRLPGLVVAYSGGADSAFLLAAAVRALGPERVLAVTADSDSLPGNEKTAALGLADQLGVQHRLVATHEMAREGYRANAGDRCYFCKAELLEVVSVVADGLGWPVATGTNADDLRSGFRPGIRAAAERGALTPLADLGLTKAEVRAQSRSWGLPTWDKPAAACLSSRIAYGLEITPSRLALIERAEAGVRAALVTAGIDSRGADLRVRDLGAGRARVELDEPTLDALEHAEGGALAGGPLEGVRAVVHGCGFTDVEINRFRSGSLNDALRGGSELEASGPGSGA